MGLKVITGPAAEPITLAEAKAHCRVFISDDDTLITGLIVAARQAVEHRTERALMTQTLELALDAFQDEIELPRPPLASVTSVKYLDADGELQTLAADQYLVEGHGVPARVMPAFDVDWPTTREQANAVLIRYTAGYESAAAVPQQIKSWMLMRIGMLYENRESVAAGISLAEVPFVDSLLDPYRVWSV